MKQPRLMGDLAYAEQWIARAHAYNALVKAEALFIKNGGELWRPASRGEVKIRMTAQQVFLGMARSYATNEELAEFLYGRINDATLGRLRVALHEVAKIIGPDTEPLLWERPDGVVEVEPGFDASTYFEAEERRLHKLR